MLQWMFFEQYSHEPYVAVPRFWLTKNVEVDPDTLAERRRVGYLAFDAMESYLAGNDYLAAGRYTLADIALYAYTHVAHEGGFDMSGYPAIAAWVERVASRPGHVPITA
jgi:glutathione S-transferase